NLPAKSVEEALRHRQEYDEMVAEAKKRGIKFNSRRSTRRVRELWWQGLPPSVRGKVWSLAVGNELNITPGLYSIFSYSHTC
ncbi:hypothetical protein Celaphus_00008496, partial [Cervus elaphus hippelaphus]